MRYNLKIIHELTNSTELDIYQNVEFVEAETVKKILRNGLFRGKEFSIPKIEEIVEDNNTILANKTTSLDDQITYYIEQVGILSFVRHSLAIKLDPDLISKFTKIAKRNYDVKEPLDIHILTDPERELNKNNIYYFTEPANIQDTIKSANFIESKIRQGLQDVAKGIRKNLKKDSPPSSADYFEFTAFYDFNAILFELTDVLKSQEYIHMAKDLQKYGLVGIKVPEEFELDK